MAYQRSAADIEVIKARVDEAKQALTTQLSALTSSDDWKRTLTSMAVLGRTSIARLSFRNFILTLSQRPTITHAATFQSWRALGRAVRKGERALYVLKPRFARRDDASKDEDKKLVGFGVLPLFAFEQTDGPPLETAVAPVDFESAAGFAHTVERLRIVALERCQHVEAIDLRPRTSTDQPGVFGWFHRPTRRIVVLTDTSSQQQFATLVHELAHAILHGADDHHSRARKEVEAESTSFVVCHALGLDTSSFALPYVATWAGGDLDEVAEAGENVRRASMTILDALLADEASTPDPEESAAAHVA